MCTLDAFSWAKNSIDHRLVSLISKRTTRMWAPCFWWGRKRRNRRSSPAPRASPAPNRPDWCLSVASSRCRLLDSLPHNILLGPFRCSTRRNKATYGWCFWTSWERGADTCSKVRGPCRPLWNRWRSAGWSWASSRWRGDCACSELLFQVRQVPAGLCCLPHRRSIRKFVWRGADRNKWQRVAMSPEANLMKYYTYRVARQANNESVV